MPNSELQTPNSRLGLYLYLCSMAFYESIADYYDHIFPLNPAQPDYVKNDHLDISEKKLLDVGCGTGSLSIALAPHFKEVTAIDPDKSMLDLAITKAGKDHPNLAFHPWGMLEIESKFRPGQFDTILCFGNTLVHLGSEEEILDFLRQAKQILKPGGKLLLQIIHYDRIFDRKLTALPTIENDAVKFARNYYYPEDENSLDFETILSIKESGNVIRNNLRLLPIRSKRLRELIAQAGFSDAMAYGSFKKDAFSNDSIAFIVDATS